MLRSRKSVVAWAAAFLLLGLGVVLVPSLRAQQNDLSEDDFKTAVAPGKRTFTSTCAGCHGLDGRGSERAPTLAGPKVQRLSDAKIANIISNGIPATGMPAFHALKAEQVTALVRYIRILEGNVAARAPIGDPARGKTVFFGKGECSSCHTVSGEGGFLGPDLTAYGSTMSATAIIDAIVKPARIVPHGYRAAAVTASDGQRLEGLVRNEDNFSLQLQAKDGSFHFFQKTDVLRVEYLDSSLMPTNYGERLSRGELGDLATYLMSTSPPPAGDPKSNKEE